MPAADRSQPFVLITRHAVERMRDHLPADADAASMGEEPLRRLMHGMYFTGHALGARSADERYVRVIHRRTGAELVLVCIDGPSDHPNFRGEPRVVILTVLTLDQALDKLRDAAPRKLPRKKPA